MPPRTNAKAQAGRDRKADQKASKDAQAAQANETQVAQDWTKGSNQRGASRAEGAAAKADEAARKRREKEELLAAEESEMSGLSKSKTKKTSTLSKKKKGKGGDLSLLEDALVTGAEKKFKKKQKEERLKKEKQEQIKASKATAAEGELPILDPLLANTQAMHGMDGEGGGGGGGALLVGRQANKALADTSASGIDAAIGSLTVGGGGAGPDEHPEKRMKALYKAFEEKMLPVVKDDYPGLRLSQYKEKIFNLWKKSSENPMNQQQHQQV